MTAEAQWRAFWTVWVTAFAVGETVALYSRHPHAPLSHHARALLRARDTRTGAVVLAAGSAWLIHHLYKEANDEIL